MKMLTVRLFNNDWDAVQTKTVQVPVGWQIVVGTVLADPPASTRAALNPAVIFEVPDSETQTEPVTFKIVRDGVVIGDQDHNQRIGSYFADLYSEHAWHVFLVRP